MFFCNAIEGGGQSTPFQTSRTTLLVPFHESAQLSDRTIKQETGTYRHFHKCYLKLTSRQMARKDLEKSRLRLLLPSQKNFQLIPNNKETSGIIKYANRVLSIVIDQG